MLLHAPDLRYNPSNCRHDLVFLIQNKFLIVMDDVHTFQK